MNKIVSIVMLIFGFFGIFNVVAHILELMQFNFAFEYLDIGLTIIVFMFLLCFTVKDYEDSISSMQLLTMKKYQKYIELINSIYNFDYSNLKVIQRIFYKDNKFCIIVNDVEVWIVKEALLCIKTQDDLIDLDEILNKQISENRANLTLDSCGYQTYVNGALGIFR